MIEQGTILHETYKITKAIGEGGGGEIYLADHLRLEKPVVLKKIKDSVKGRIEERGEADIMKKLRHPYLPPIHDYFTENNQVYTVMEYIEGENFQQLLAQGKSFSMKDIVKWGTQLSDVLVYLHSQEPPIIHRDIKPANIMLTPTGNICLIDFNVSLEQDEKKGIMAHSDGYSPLEQYGVIREGNESTSEKSKNTGTEKTEILDASVQQNLQETLTELLQDSGNAVSGDSATEILDGNASETDETELLFQESEKRVCEGALPNGSMPAGKSSMERKYEVRPMVDERSDIYSLGATLYHMVTRKRPEKATERVTPLSECDGRASDGLVYIIEKAMQREPEKRFQTAKEMHSAFKNIKKLDREYIAYAFQRDVLIGIVIAAACVSIICTVLGHKRMEAEAYNTYVAQIETANEFYLQGKMEEANEACERAVEMRPEDLTAYVELIHIYYKQQRYSEGIARIQQLEADAEKITEENGIQWATLQFLAGECYMGLEEFNLAADSYKKAIEFQPKEGNYYTRCAIALARAGDKEGAEMFLEDALQEGISDAALYLTKAEIMLSEKKYEEAETLIYKVFDMTEDGDISYHAYLTAAQIYEDGRNTIDGAEEKERELLETAVERLDSSYGLSLSEKLADIYYGLAGQEKEEEKAKEYYEKALLHFNSIYQNGYRNLHVLQNIAVINQTLGNYEEAEAALLDMVEIYPEDYRGYMYLTLLYSEIQNKISIEKRDYSIIFEYYDKAESRYQRGLENGEGMDTKMQFLEGMIEDLEKLTN